MLLASSPGEQKNATESVTLEFLLGLRHIWIGF